MKKFIFVLFLFNFFFINERSQAGEEDEKNSSVSVKLPKEEHPPEPNLGAMPFLAIEKMGDELFDVDFLSFLFTNRRIYTQLTQSTHFTPPEDQQQLRERIYATPLLHLPLLIQEWGRRPGKAIPLLHSACPDYEYTENPMGDLKLLRKEFKNYVKFIHLLYAIGDKDIRTDIQVFYHPIVSFLSDEWAEQEALYPFHLKNGGLLYFQRSLEASSKFEQGTTPFPKDDAKANKYNAYSNLPLCQDLFKD